MIIQDYRVLDVIISKKTLFNLINIVLQIYANFFQIITLHATAT